MLPPPNLCKKMCDKRQIGTKENSTDNCRNKKIYTNLKERIMAEHLLLRNEFYFYFNYFLVFIGIISCFFFFFFFFFVFLKKSSWEFYNTLSVLFIYLFIYLSLFFFFILQRFFIDLFSSFWLLGFLISF